MFINILFNKGIIFTYLCDFKTYPLDLLQKLRCFSKARIHTITINLDHGNYENLVGQFASLHLFLVEVQIDSLS